ncbi:hypothetical protein, partial [Sporisorium scitamineum]
MPSVILQAPVPERKCTQMKWRSSACPSSTEKTSSFLSRRRFDLASLPCPSGPPTLSHAFNSNSDFDVSCRRIICYDPMPSTQELQLSSNHAPAVEQVFDAQLPGICSNSADQRSAAPVRQLTPPVRSSAMPSTLTPAPSNLETQVKKEANDNHLSDGEPKIEATEATTDEPLRIYIDLCDSDDENSQREQEKERDKRQRMETRTRNIDNWLLATTSAYQDPSLRRATPPSTRSSPPPVIPHSPSSSAFSEYLDKLLGPDFARKNRESPSTTMTTAPSRGNNGVAPRASRKKRNKFKADLNLSGPCDRCKARKINCVNTSKTNRKICDSCSSTHTACLRNGQRRQLLYRRPGDKTSQTSSSSSYSKPAQKHAKAASSSQHRLFDDHRRVSKGSNHRSSVRQRANVGPTLIRTPDTESDESEHLGHSNNVDLPTADEGSEHDPAESSDPPCKKGVAPLQASSSRSPNNDLPSLPQPTTLSKPQEPGKSAFDAYTVNLLKDVRLALERVRGSLSDPSALLAF